MAPGAACLTSSTRPALVSYAKPPFGGATAVYEYLGRYTHRVGLSNHRLLNEGRRHRHLPHARRPDHHPAPGRVLAPLPAARPALPIRQAPSLRPARSGQRQPQAARRQAAAHGRHLSGADQPARGPGPGRLPRPAPAPHRHRPHPLPRLQGSARLARTPAATVEGQLMTRVPLSSGAFFLGSWTASWAPASDHPPASASSSQIDPDPCTLPRTPRTSTPPPKPAWALRPSRPGP